MPRHVRGRPPWTPQVRPLGGQCATGSARKLPAPAGPEPGTDLTGRQHAGQDHPPIRAHPIPGPTVSRLCAPRKNFRRCCYGFEGGTQEAAGAGARAGAGAGSGSQGSLGSVPASGDCHSHPRGGRWHHRCVFFPPEKQRTRGSFFP